MISFKNILFSIAAVILLHSCQNISTQQCTHSYQLNSIEPRDKAGLPLGKSNSECLHIASRARNYDILSVNIELKDEEWMKENPEQLKNFSINYALDIYNGNSRNDSIEAIIISFKKNLDDLNAIRHFEFSAKDLKSIQ